MRGYLQKQSSNPTEKSDCGVKEGCLLCSWIDGSACPRQSTVHALGTLVSPGATEPRVTGTESHTAEKEMPQGEAGISGESLMTPAPSLVCIKKYQQAGGGRVYNRETE